MSKRDRADPATIAEITQLCGDARRLWLNATHPSHLAKAVDLYKSFLAQYEPLEVAHQEQLKQRKKEAAEAKRKAQQSSAASPFDFMSVFGGGGGGSSGNKPSSSTTASSAFPTCHVSGAKATTSSGGPTTSCTASSSSSCNLDDEFLFDPCFVDEQKMRLLLLLSQIDGREAEAREMLQKEGYVATLAKGVLNYDTNPQSTQCVPVPAGAKPDIAATPCVVVDEVLQQSALVALQNIFAPPNASYWTAHKYCVEPPSPFFSYVVPLVEAHKLGPLGALALAVQHTAEQHFPDAPKAHYGEVWVHNRPHGVGHQLHFDSDDEGRGGIRNPVLGSLFFLSHGVGGPTLITDQGVSDRKLAEKGWVVHPQQNRLVVFDGKKLHGVVPGKGCANKKSSSDDDDDTAAAASAEEAVKTDCCTVINDGSASTAVSAEDLERYTSSRRVTLMVALWPDIKIRREKEPGSARPLPSFEKRAELPWMRALEPADVPAEDSATAVNPHFGSQRLSQPPCIAPVWEKSEDGSAWPLGAPIPHYDTVFQGF